MITALAPEECQQLLDSSNEVCQLLLAHMIAMYLIMRPVSCRERTAYTATMYGIRMTSWIDHISECLSEEHKAYLTWPLLVSELNRNKILEQYTLSEEGAQQWGRRMIDGSTLSGPALMAMLSSPSSATSVSSLLAMIGTPG